MKLYHVTPAANKNSILRDGILMSRARGARPAIWLGERELVPWAVDHVRRRHGREDVCVLYVRVHKRLLRHRWHRMWTTTRDVPARDILGELVWE